VKTLFVIHDAPYPARSGSPLRCWHNINVLAQRGPVYVFSVGRREPEITAMPIVSDWVHVDPQQLSSGKCGPLSRLARLFRQRQYPVDDRALEAMIDRRLRGFIDRLRPDLVILAHWQEAFPAALEGFAPVIADAHNIESLLVRESIGADRSLATLRHRLRAWRWRRRERELFRKARGVWVTSDDDARNVALLGKDLPKPIVWPNVVDVDYYADVLDGRMSLPDGFAKNGRTIAFVGFYAWPPNAHAAMTLIEEIFPIVASRFPASRLLLVGKEPTTRMREAAQRDPRIVVTGMVDDVRPYLALTDVCVIPLTQGGGTRLKILESFASGVPVISTAKGAEGLDVRDGEHIVIAQEPARMASAIIECFTDPQARRAQVQNALALVRRGYSRDTLRERLDEALAASLTQTR